MDARLRTFVTIFRRCSQCMWKSATAIKIRSSAWSAGLQRQDRTTTITSNHSTLPPILCLKCGFCLAMLFKDFPSHLFPSFLLRGPRPGEPVSINRAKAEAIERWPRKRLLRKLQQLRFSASYSLVPQGLTYFTREFDLHSAGIYPGIRATLGNGIETREQTRMDAIWSTRRNLPFRICSVYRAEH